MILMIYINGIYCQLGDYMPPTTFYGNQKQSLIYTRKEYNIQTVPSNLSVLPAGMAAVHRLSCCEGGWWLVAVGEDVQQDEPLQKRGFPKMVVPNNHGFPTEHDHFGVFWGVLVPPFKETPIKL